jgi:hypothetical protein
MPPGPTIAAGKSRHIGRTVIPAHRRSNRRAAAIRALAVMAALHSSRALAGGKFEDQIADVVVWIVVIIVPVVGIAVFWILHVWPEKVAERKNHPQASAIQALCLMSLVFGGLLWPLAMLWAYMKPLEFRLARDDDDDRPLHPGDTVKRVPATAPAEPSEVNALREHVAALQKRLDALDAARKPISTG